MKTSMRHSAIALLAGAALAIGCTGTESTSPKPMDRKLHWAPQPPSPTPPAPIPPPPPNLNGYLDVRTAGLAAGLVATITITGPINSGGAQPPQYGFQMGEVFLALPAGDYYVYVGPVRQGRVLYTPERALTLATVTGGATTRLTIRFSGSGPVCPRYVCGPRP